MVRDKAMVIRLTEEEREALARQAERFVPEMRKAVSV